MWKKVLAKLVNQRHHEMDRSRVGPRSGPRHELQQLGPIQAGRGVVAPGPRCNPRLNRETTILRQPQHLTRMHHEHDDDTDWLQERQTISTPKTVLWFLNNRTERLPGGTAYQCRRR